MLTTPIPMRSASATTISWCRRVSAPFPGCRSSTRRISSTGTWSIMRCRASCRRANFSRPRHGAGVWAPAIRFHAGRYWIYYPDPDYGIYVITAADPRGAWSAPVLVKAGRGLIDPCPLWDDDGSVYLIHAFARSRAGFANVLHLNRLTADGTTGGGRRPHRHRRRQGSRATRPSKGRSCTSATAGTTSSRRPEVSSRAGNPSSVRAASTDPTKSASSLRRARPTSTVHTRERSSIRRVASGGSFTSRTRRRTAGSSTCNRWCGRTIGR